MDVVPKAIYRDSCSAPAISRVITTPFTCTMLEIPNHLSTSKSSCATEHVKPATQTSRARGRLRGSIPFSSPGRSIPVGDPSPNIAPYL